MANKNSDFLGGGTQFNKVGAEAPGGDTAPADAPRSMQPHQIRAILIAVMIVAMLVAVFFISNPAGIMHREGRGGRQIDDKPALDDRAISRPTANQ